MNLATFILLFIFSINLLLLFFILMQRHRPRFSYVFFMVFLITIWQGMELFTVLFLLDSKPNVLLLAVRIGLLPALYFAPVFVRLAYGMFDKWNKLPRYQRWLWFAPAIVSSPLAFTEYNVSEVVVSNGRALYIPGILYWFFAIYFAILMIGGLYVLIYNRKQSNQIAKRQIDYIFVATALTAVISLLAAVIMPLFGFIGGYYLAVNSTIFFTSIITYALFRYRFFGLQVSFYQTIFDLLRLFLTAVTFYAFYFLVQDVTNIDFDKFINIFYFFLFTILTSPILFSLINKVVSFLLTNPINEVIEIEDKIATCLRSEEDINTSLTKLAHQVSKVVNYRDFYIYLTSLNDKNVFRQIFPVGERTINRSASTFVKYLEENKKMLNVAEVLYFNEDKKLIEELSSTDIDIVLPIYYNKELVGLVVIDNDHKLLSIQQLKFLQQVNKYLNISIGSFLLYQQALANKIK